MPTTHPRYTVTDTGDVREMLDVAQRHWPDVADRRKLLLRLVAEGRAVIAQDVEDVERDCRRRRQREALGRAGELLETDGLLSDVAWR